MRRFMLFLIAAPFVSSAHQALQHGTTLIEGKNASAFDFEAKAIAAKAKNGINKFVYVKFHHVGSETVKQVLDARQQDSPTVDKFKVHTAFMTDHTRSLAELEKWSKHGKVDDHTWSTVILRSPGEKFLSAFYTQMFYTGKDHDCDLDQGPCSVKEAKKQYPDLDKYVKSREWKSTWEVRRERVARTRDSISIGSAHSTRALPMPRAPQTDAIGRFFREEMFMKHNLTDKCQNVATTSVCEYSFWLGDAANAKKVLKSFSVVGITEDADCFMKQNCALIGLEPDKCLEAVSGRHTDEATETKHSRPKHPSLSDFSADFQEWFKETFAKDFEIYDIAKQIAEEQRAKGVYGHAVCEPTAHRSKFDSMDDNLVLG